MSTSVADRAAIAMDKYVLWELGRIPISMPRSTAFDFTEPHEFWRQSRIFEPSEVHIAREIAIRDRGRVRVVDLEGPSYGPGTHPGAHKLIARAHLRTDDPNAPTVLILHGFAIPVAFWEEWQCRQISARGANVIRLDHPFHLRRRARGMVSGQGYFSADPRHLRDVMRQSAEDAAALVRWAQQELHSDVSVFGVSLGGGTACHLAANVELSSMVAIAPFCDPATTLLTNLPRRLRFALGVTGDSYGAWGVSYEHAHEALSNVLAPMIAKNLATPATSPDRMVLVHPTIDQIVGPKPIEELAETWGCDRWTYRHSHISVMRARGLMPRVHDFLLVEPTAASEGAVHARTSRLAG